MITRYTHKQMTWIDVVSPTAEEIRELVLEAGIPPEFTNDLTTMTPRTETFTKKGALKITLDFPIVKRTDIDHPHEVKFIVTKNHLVTIRFEDIEALHRFAKEFEVFCAMNQRVKGSSSLRVFFTMLSYLYEAMNVKLQYVESKLHEVEGAIFNNQEKEMVYEISHLSRRLIDFRQVMAAHERALETLAHSVSTAFPGDHAQSVESLHNHYRHVDRSVTALLSAAEDLRDTNTALLTTKQNNVMQMFTILAFICFPLTLFTSMFGMNTQTTPIIGQPGDFWIILTIMVVVSVVFFIYFRYKRWF